MTRLRGASWLTSVVIIDAVALLLLFPHWAELARDVAAPHRWLEQVGADRAAITLGISRRISLGGSWRSQPRARTDSTPLARRASAIRVALRVGFESMADNSPTIRPASAPAAW